MVATASSIPPHAPRHTRGRSARNVTEERDMAGEIDPETARLLKEYLRSAADEDRARKSAADREEQKRHIEEIHRMVRDARDWQLEHGADDKENFALVRGDIKGLSLRVGTMESQVEKVEEKIEKMEGKFDEQEENTLTGLKTELERERQKTEKRKELKEARRYNATEWLKQNWISILISAVSAAIAAYATFRR
jgi:TolA-binding protein